MSTNTIWQERDAATSNSYTLHKIPVSLPDKLQTPFDAVKELRNCFIGNLTFKRSTSGMTTTCYLHLFGVDCVKGRATGCGYDVQSAAFESAWEKCLPLLSALKETEPYFTKLTPEINTAIAACNNAGSRWKDALATHAEIFAAHIGG